MTPQQPQGLGDAQWRVLKKALSYPRVTRFESMTDFIEALDVQEAESMTVDMPAPVRFSESDDSGNASRWLIGLVILAALGIVGANQLGYLDELKARYLAERPASDAGFVDAPEVEPTEVAPTITDEAGDAGTSEPTQQPPGADVAADAEPAGTPIEDAPFEDLDNAIAEFAAETDETATGSAAESEVIEGAVEAAEDVSAPAVDVEIPAPEQLVEPLVDFSALPPPTAIVAVSSDVDWPRTVTVTLNEAGGEATVDLVRRDADFPLTLRVEEVSYSGSRSPWATGQYAFSDNGVVEFPAGQERARIALSMAPDNLREADQQSVLRIRDADTPDAGLATITVVLEDDDQRVFESTLPANTVAFAASQVTVNEADPAVQLDIIRYNPDDQPMRVGYTLRDITASQGEDYFAPGGYTIEFGPGQRSTRLLIPLVQDSTYEDNEAFSVELSNADSTVDTGIFRRVAVLIRDDDQ
jgi:hypothetical protein